MENICKNKIIIEGIKEDILKLKDFCGENFDFNKIKPAPDILNTSHKKQTPGEVKVFCDKNKVCHKVMGIHDKELNCYEDTVSFNNNFISLPEAVVMGYTPCPGCLNITTKNDTEIGKSIAFSIEDSIKLMQEFGYDNWREWRAEKWGTQYPAFDIYIEWWELHTIVNFNTILSPPLKIYSIIANKFPNLLTKCFYKSPLSKEYTFKGSF